MEFSIASFFKQYGYRRKDIEKARVFEAIIQNSDATRKQLYLDLKVRPNNVSTAVQELLENELIYEDIQIRNFKKGRPEIKLGVHVNKLIAISVWVSSNNLVGALINLGGEISNLYVKELPSASSNKEFTEATREIITHLVNCRKEDQELLGIGFCLPGVVNQQTKNWIFNSRWPNVSNLDLGRFSLEYNIPVEIIRKLESELISFLNKNPKYQESSSILIHWGYGIGAAYAHKGKVLHSYFGSFGEIGHLKHSEQHGIKCACNEYDCIETVAAGWSLLPHLEKQVGPLPDSEEELAERCKEVDLYSIAEMKDAISAIVSAISTTCRIINPQIMFIYGPFLANKKISEILVKELYTSIPSYNRDYIEIVILEEDLTKLGPLGSTNKFFITRLKDLLTADN